MLCYFVINNFAPIPTPGKLYAWWGLTIRMSMFGLSNRKLYWQKNPCGVDFGFREVMSMHQWDMIWRYLPPLDPPNTRNIATLEPVPDMQLLAS